MQTLKDFHPLRPAEEKLVEACRTGAEARIAAIRPDEATDDNTVRGPLIRFLALGGDAEHPTHAKGVRLFGAWIEDELDFEAADIARPLWLTDCHIAKTPVFRDATARIIGLSGSKVPGMNADRLMTTGSVFLRNGFETEGEVRLSGARIGGDLSCAGGKFRNANGTALNASRLLATGHVQLRDGFYADGEVRLNGASIGSNLECRACRMINSKGIALSADSIKVTGTFHLHGGTEVKGILDLTHAKLGLISDEPACWPERGKLSLDQASYYGFGKSTTAEERLQWLELQDSTMVGEIFWPQPYEQLAKVLRATGHHADARKVLIEKERLMRKYGLIDGFWSRLWHWLSGAVVGYGYRPSLALVWLAGFLILGMLWFDVSYKDGAMVPNDTRVLLSDSWTNCETLRAFGGVREKDETVVACWLRSDKGRDYQRFLPLTYAADTFLPIVNLHQEPNWIPQPERGTWWLPRGARIFLWLYIIFGWALTALAVAGFTGLVKRD